MGRSPSASPMTMTSTKGPTGTGLENVNGPPTTTKGKVRACVARSAASAGIPARSRQVTRPASSSSDASENPTTGKSLTGRPDS